jgi:dTDP-4-dehydrorhamnose reductase
MKILVTGANGQLGSEIKKLSPLFSRFEFIFTDVNELDITDRQACREMFDRQKPFFVINCAAYTAVDKAESDTELAWKLNVGAVENLVSACEICGSYFIHISTDYVFDGKSYIPYVETDKTAPQSEYGKGKLAGENVALSYSKSAVIRTSWLYSAIGSNFVKTIAKLAGERKSLNVVFDQTGTPTYAGDLALTILQIADKIAGGEKEFAAGIYHYSNEGVCSWYDFACAIVKIKRLDCKINPVETKDYPVRATRPPYSVLNKSKIKSAYDVEINHWHTSLEKMLNIKSED